MSFYKGNGHQWFYFNSLFPLKKWYVKLLTFKDILGKGQTIEMRRETEKVTWSPTPPSPVSTTQGSLLCLLVNADLQRRDSSPSW